MLSHEFSRTENRILGALSRLDDFPMNPLIQGYSGTAPETSPNAYGTNKKLMRTTPRVILILKQASIRATLQTALAQKMALTWWQEFKRKSLLPKYIFRKAEKNRSTNQPQFSTENTTATIEADQNLLALQQLASNNNSANFHKISRISKLVNSLLTTMPTFDGKSENFELFEYLLQTSLKIHNQLTDENRINYFHFLMKEDALQTFKNTNGATRHNLGEILAVCRRKYVKPQSTPTAKHKFQKIFFNPANQKLVDFLDELEKLAKDAFGTGAHAIIGQFIYAKMPPHLKKSVNQAHLENGT